jgi:hypothetical protein
LPAGDIQVNVRPACAIGDILNFQQNAASLN